MNTLTTPQGQFQLIRYPQRRNETLRAWDAADEYLLQQLADEELLKPDTSILIVNDSFGALTTALAEHHPQALSDSYIAHCGIKTNLKQNGKAVKQVTLLNSLQHPQGPLDLLVIRVPKSLAMLEDQLLRLRPLLHAKTRVMGAGMVKNIHNSTLKLFEQMIGSTKTSLARKKARLIFSQFDSTLEHIANPYPSTFTLEDTEYEISNHASLFSRERLDIGTRFLLQHLPPSKGAQQIIDLGCGNGVVGLMAAAQNLEAKLTFVDESFMAVESAKMNFKAAFGYERRAKFSVTDCLQSEAANSADLILNNPPFHQQHVIGDAIAWQMFKESKAVLKPKGELWVIGNRHLAYQVKLKRIFGNCKIIASNKKFDILRAVKSA